MFKFTKLTGTKSSTLVKDAEDLYSLVERATGDELEAIEASSWAEIARIGDEYEHEAFAITVED